MEARLITGLRSRLKAVILPLSMMGLTLMCGPMLERYYPIKDLQTDLIRSGRRMGRKTARKILQLID